MENKEEVLRKIQPLLKAYYEAFNRTEFIPGKTRINVGWPVYDEKEVMRILSSLLDMRISQGPAVLEFERMFASYQNTKHAVAVNSGSSANLLALSAFLEANDIKPGDEVIVPAATFTTVASPIIQLGLTPVFVDVELDTYNIDPKEIEKAISKKTKIIMPVHSLGNPASMPQIMEIARKHNLKVLEDFCESHGAEISGKKVGSFGDMSTVSFFVAHNMTTGEGGMVFSNNTHYDRILRSMREFGRFNDESVGRFDYTDEFLGNYDTRYVFQRLGFNIRMTDLTASAGIEQLKKLDAMNKERIEICNTYIEFLKKYEKWLQLPVPRKGSVHTYYGFQVLVRKQAPFSRKELTQYLESHNIETRPFFGGCLPDQPAFRNKPMRVVGNLPVSRFVKDSAFFIGCHPAIGNEGKNYVISTFRQFLEKYEK